MSKLTDLDLATAINAFMHRHPHCNRGELRKMFNTSAYRLEKLEGLGLVKLPLPLTRSMAGTLGRKKNGTGNNFIINRPAPWQRKLA